MVLYKAQHTHGTVQGTAHSWYCTKHVTHGTVQGTAHSWYCTRHNTLMVLYKAQHTHGTVQGTAHLSYCTRHSDTQSSFVSYIRTRKKAHLFLIVLWLLLSALRSPCSHPSLAALFNHQQTQKTQEYLFPSSLASPAMPCLLYIPKSFYSMKQEMYCTAQWRGNRLRLFGSVVTSCEVRA